MGGEAEDIVVVLVLVSQAIVANAWYCVLAAAWSSRVGDGILDRAIIQPASIAPVHPSSPCIIQLIEGCHDGILVMTCPHSIVEIEVVATQAGIIWEHDPYTESCEKEKREQRKRND